MKHVGHLNRQRGFTLIEILIAMLMGLFLLGGLFQIFMASKKTYRTQESLSRMQEDGRFAMDFLSREIRMAGFLGCNNSAKIQNTLNSKTDFLYRFETPIEGFEATSTTEWTPSKDAAITSPLPGSDIISIRRADDQSFAITAHPTADSDITVSASGLKKCDIVMVSDCSSAAVFQVSAVAGDVLTHIPDSVINATTCSPKNESADLGKSYAKGQAYPINTISYYIRENPNKEPALYRKAGINNAEEVIAGVEQMQVLYGVDNGSGSPSYYVTADQISPPDWSKVLSVRISLLVRSAENNLTDHPVNYTYNSLLPITPGDGDHYLRRVFTSTIALRNRLP